MKPDQYLVTKAEAEMFPANLPPVSADTLAQYTFLIGRIAPRGYGERLASLHGRALGTNETLAALLRSPEALADVGEAAASSAPPDYSEPVSVTQARAADSAIGAYKRAIAEQLSTTTGTLAKHGRVYLAAVAARELAVAEERRLAEERAAAAAALEAKRLETERVAAAEAERAAAAAEERQMLADMARVRAVIEDTDRARVQAIVALRRRLRVTKATAVRVGPSAWSTRNLEHGIGDFSVEECARYTEALDRAEAAL